MNEFQDFTPKKETMLNALSTFLVLFILLLNTFTLTGQKITDTSKKATFDNLEKEGQEAYNKGDFAKTLSIMEKAMLIVKEFYAPEDTMYVQYCMHLGSIHRQMAHHDLAKKHLEEARDRAMKGMGKNSSFYTDAQNTLAMLHEEMGNFEEGERLFLEVLATQEASVGKESSVYATTLNNLASLYKEKGMFEKAIPLYEESIAIRGRVLGLEHQLYAEALNNLGSIYEKLGDFKEAESIYIKSRSILAKAVGTQHPNYAGITNNLAYLYIGMQHFEQAEPLFQEALAIWEKMLGKEHPYYAKGITNLGILYATKKDYAKASIYFEQVCQVRAKIYGKQHPEYATSLNNLSSVYVDSKEYKKAEKILLEVLAIRTKVFGKTHPIYAATLNNLAHVYNKSNQFEKAIPLYKESVSVKQQKYGKHHHEIASTLNSFAVAYESRDSLEQALNYVLLALEAVSTNWDITAISYPTCLKDLKKIEVNSKSTLLRILNTTRAIERRYHKRTNNLANLEQSYQICKLILELNEQYRQEFSTEEDKLHFLTESVPFINEGIKLAVLLDELDKNKNYHVDAFAMAEQNKSVLLTSALKAQRARTFGGLPTELAIKEQDLQKELSNIKKQLLNSSDDQEKQGLIKKLNEINLKIEQFKKDIESKYPKYFKTKYESTTAKAADIQKLLDNKTALLEYFVSDSTIYLFCITTDTVEAIKLNTNKEELKLNTQKMRRVLSDYAYIKSNSSAVWNTYIEMGHWFYANLLETALTSVKGIEHLIIITDGELGHLPFEAFLTEKSAMQSKDQDYKSLSYLLKKYKISYNYSATLFKENRSVETTSSNGKILAFAASYGEEFTAKSESRGGNIKDLRGKLGALPAVTSEVKKLEEIFSGAFFYKENASEGNFKQNAEDYDIFHLAMHGILNNQYPILSSMAFTENGDSLDDNFLQAYEISNMHVNAKMVVLSACETGYGKFAQGEGVLSLARSFMYAGVPSLVVSLWQVNDGSTAAIMISFYENLANGMPKDEALRQAKLTYIEKAKGLTAHPAFWSPFIQLGDSRPISIKRKGGDWTWWIGGAALVLVLGGGLFYWKKSA